MVKAGIVGGTGYSGVELLRLLAQHPRVELKAITSRKEAGTPVAAMFPSLRRRVELAFTEPNMQALRGCDVVFFATPNAVAMNEARALLDSGARLVDLSADFRLKDVAEWEKWYGVKHAAPELVRDAVYGLCELNRERIRGARLVANPGCYPTATRLGFLPLVEAGVIDLDHLVADAKSGVSGAGRKADLHLSFSEAADNFMAYNVPGHRHWPEIRQGLAQAAKREVGLVFTAHLTPLIRGIHATLYGRITREVDFQSLFEKRYAGEPVVDVMPAGSHRDPRAVRAARRDSQPDSLVLALDRHRGAARHLGGLGGMDLRRRAALCRVRPQRSAGGAARDAQCARGRARRAGPPSRHHECGRQPPGHRAHRRAEARPADPRAGAGKCPGAGRAGDFREHAVVRGAQRQCPVDLPLQGGARCLARGVPPPAAASDTYHPPGP